MPRVSSIPILLSAWLALSQWDTVRLEARKTKQGNAAVAKKKKKIMETNEVAESDLGALNFRRLGGSANVGE